MFIRILSSLTLTQMVFFGLASADPDVRSGLLRFNVAAKTFEMRDKNNTTWEKIDHPLGKDADNKKDDEKSCSPGKVLQHTYNQWTYFVMAPRGDASDIRSAYCRSSFSDVTGYATVQCDGTTGTWKGVFWGCQEVDSGGE